MFQRIIMAAFIGALALSGAPQELQAKTGSGPHLTLELVTDVPLHAGGRLDMDLPSGLKLHTTLGGMPEDYIGVINSAVISLGGYDTKTAEVVAAALKDSLVWRVHVGWRPSVNDAFYLSAGYTLITLGGGVSGEDLLSLATDEEPDSVSTAHVYAVDSTLHLLDVEVGWSWLFLKTYTLRVSAGFSGTINASTKVSPQFAPIGDTGENAKTFTDAVETFLDATYEGNVFTPTLSLAVGIRLF
jgi:hypothetical protein